MTDPERDDDDTPNVRDDNAIHPIEAAAMAARAVGAEFFRAFKDANSGDPVREVRGLVEMMVLTIAEGEMPGRDFAGLPAHLPDTEREMRVLALSKVAADAPLKADLLAWARGNRDHHDKAAKALANAVDAYRRAYELLAKREDDELGEWCAVLRKHILAVWKVNLREAPAEGIEAWARDTVGRFDITPTWLQERGKPEQTFDPAEHRARPTRGPAKNPMRSFKARGDD